MELKVGDKAPSFKCVDQNGKIKTNKDYEGKPYVLYFYPRASTPGCTTQSCNLRDAAADLKKLKSAVIGVSGDSVEKQKKFDEKNDLGFTLLADEEKKIIESYDVWRQKSMYGKKFLGIVRSCFVIDAKGKIAGANYKISPKDTVPFAKDILESL